MNPGTPGTPMTLPVTVCADVSSVVGKKVTPSRPPILSRALALVFFATIGTAASFYLLLTVVPLYATLVGAGEVGAGLATAALMLATVAAELVTTRLVTRFGYRHVFAVGTLLLGLPALALPAADTMAAILAVCIVRGFGFAIVVVAVGALVAGLVPQERRGEGLGIFGVVVGIPSVVALPLGVWLAGQVGYPAVFVAGGVAALSALVVVPNLPGRASAPEEAVGVFASLRMPALVRPSLVFSVTAMAAGVIVTFLPLAVTHAPDNLAALGLLVQAATSTAARWWAGRQGDRHGSVGLLVPGLLASALGMLVLVLNERPIAVVLGTAVFGAGFGIAQNASLAMMFDRVSTTGYAAVSALWNIAYDAGLGVGAAGFGLIATHTGYPTAFAIFAVLMLAALIPARLDRAAGSPPRCTHTEADG